MLVTCSEWEGDENRKIVKSGNSCKTVPFLRRAALGKWLNNSSIVSEMFLTNKCSGQKDREQRTILCWILRIFQFNSLGCKIITLYSTKCMENVIEK